MRVPLCLAVHGHIADSVRDHEPAPGGRIALDEEAEGAVHRTACCWNSMAHRPRQSQKTMRGPTVWLAHGPLSLPRCIRRLPCSMDARTYSRLSSTVSTCRKAGREDPGCLGVQKLPPGWVRAARRRVDVRGTQDLPDGGWRDCHAEFRQFAVDPAVFPQRVLLRQPSVQRLPGRSLGLLSLGKGPLPRLVCAGLRGGMCKSLAAVGHSRWGSGRHACAGATPALPGPRRCRPVP